MNGFTPNGGLSSKNDDRHSSSTTTTTSSILSSSQQFNNNNSPSSEQQRVGSLLKWTNFLYGWQKRYFVLRADGSLRYYHNSDADCQCRGMQSLANAQVQTPDFDLCRFDVCFVDDDTTWFLRASSADECLQWLDAIEVAQSTKERAQSPSLHSLQSIESSSSLKQQASTNTNELDERLQQMESFRDLMNRQLEQIQTYFDATAILGGAKPDGGAGSDYAASTTQLAVDFKGDAIAIRAATAGVVRTARSAINHALERERQMRKRFERERSKRKAQQDELATARQQIAELERSRRHSIASTTIASAGGPERQEGPNSSLTEEEFYDALDAALDHEEEEQEERDRQRRALERFHPPKFEDPTWSWLQNDIDSTIAHQYDYALRGVSVDVAADAGAWQLFHSEGEMHLYKRDVLDEQGLVVDPLKATHRVGGISARELCHYFFRPEWRFDWEFTVEKVDTVATLSDSTLILQQMHKRIWPAAQRYALFWSAMRQRPVPLPEDGDHLLDGRKPLDSWIVCNRSVSLPDDLLAPVTSPSSGCVCVDMTICLVAQTYSLEDQVPEGGGDSRGVDRSSLVTRIAYCAVVNPGGWVPISALRTVYKREYPRFLRRLTEYVQEKVTDDEIMW